MYHLTFENHFISLMIARDFLLGFTPEREDLHRRLLSTDFKKQVDGIEMLQKVLPSIRMDVIEVQSIKRIGGRCFKFDEVLEFLRELLDTLKNEGYTMTEAEAAIFLPCLIEKILHELREETATMRGSQMQVGVGQLLFQCMNIHLLYARIMWCLWNTKTII